MNDMIKKIELNLGGKVVSLTPNQAKKLRDALNELFGETVKREYIPYPQPFIEPWRPWRWDWQEPHYLTSSGTTCAYSSDDNVLSLTI